MTHDASFSMSLPDGLSTLPELRDGLHAWLRTSDVVGTSADDVVLATWEACVNAVEHPLRPRRAVVEIEARLRADGVCVRVRDSGSWREQEPREHRGLGLTLIEALMDSTSIRSSAEGTDVVMFRSLTAFV